MNEQLAHVSEVTHIEGDTYEEYCEDCGRFVIRNYKTKEKTEIVKGDKEAIHSGGTNGLQMFIVAIEARSESDA